MDCESSHNIFNFELAHQNVRVKDLNDDATKIRLCYETLQKSPDLLPKSSDVFQPKNDKLSTEARTKGNEFFKAKEYVSAMDYYNRSICHAKSKQNLGMGYANRSAVYFHSGFWKLCLENIELALAHDYPEQFHAKLESRRKECLEKMKTREDSQVKFDKEYTPWGLTYPPNEKIPIMIDGLELAKNERFGYFVRATRDLKPGDVLMVEKTFVRHVNRNHEYQRCANCLDQNYMNLFPCERCTNVMFCSEACHEEAERRFHKYECKIKDGMNKFYENHVWPIGIAVRTVLRAFTMYEDPCELQKLVAGFGDDDDVSKIDYANLTEEQHFRAAYFLDLYKPKNPSHLYIFGNNCAAAWHLLTNFTDFPKLLKTKDLENLFLSLLFRFYKSTMNNSMAFGDKFSAGNNYAVGTLTVSKFLKHSCIPNANKYQDKSNFLLVAQHNIKAGDPILVKYSGKLNYGSNGLRKRKEQLALLDYDCNCKACLHNYPTLDEMMKTMKKSNNMDLMQFLIQCSTDSDHLKEKFDKKIGEKMLKKYVKHITKYEKKLPCIEIIVALVTFVTLVDGLINGPPLKMRLKHI